MYCRIPIGNMPFFCNKQYYKHCTIHDFSVVKKGYKNLKAGVGNVEDDMI